MNSNSALHSLAEALRSAGMQVVEYITHIEVNTWDIQLISLFVLSEGAEVSILSQFSDKKDTWTALTPIKVLRDQTTASSGDLVSSPEGTNEATLERDSALYELAVPYVSQIGAGADWSSADCGAAVVLMMARYKNPDLKATVDDLSTHLATKIWGLNLKKQEDLQSAKRRYANTADLVDLGKFCGVKLLSSWYGDKSRMMTLDRIRLEIDDGHPCGLLVGYEHLHRRFDPLGRFGHWVCCVGYNTTQFSILDPYWPGTQGLDDTWIDDERLENALQSYPPYFTMPYQGVFYRP